MTKLSCISISILIAWTGLSSSALAQGAPAVQPKYRYLADAATPSAGETVNRQYLPVKPGGKIMDGNGIIIDDSRNTQQGSKLGIYEGRVLIEGNTSFDNGGSGIHAYESDHVDILGNVVWMNNQTPEYKGGQTFVNDASDIRIEGNTIGAIEGKEATNNFRRNDRPENAGIVWKNNLIFHGKPGKGAADGNMVVELPRPMSTP